MKRTRIRMVVASVVFALLRTRTALAAESTAPNLLESREHIRNASNKKLFDYEMGITDKSPGELGEKLPEGLTRDALLFALLEQPAARVFNDVRVGAVAHPGLPGVHVVWAFVPFDYKNRAPRLHIGLLKGDAREKVEPSQWLSEPIRDMQLAQNEVPLAFDFAGFPLGRLGRAFGLRTLTHGCGAGGSVCAATNLLLFVSLQARLTKVFDAQVAFFGNFGGKWNEDGTREHIVQESNAIVRLKGGRSPTASPPMIEVVRVGRRTKKQHWTWQAQEAAEHDDGAPVTDVGSPGWYVTEDPELLGTVNDDPPNRPAHRFAPPRTFARLEQTATPASRGLGAMPGVGGGVSTAGISPRGALHGWSKLGSGMDEQPAIVAVAGPDDLFVATTSDDAKKSTVARWKSGAWSDLRCPLHRVEALAVDGARNLIAGGRLPRGSDGWPPIGVFRWNGTQWSGLAQQRLGSILALAKDGADNLYVAGEFNDMAGTKAMSIARWDGHAWFALHAGISDGQDGPGRVTALATDAAGNLYAAGQFAAAGGSPARNIAKWDGRAWSSLGDGTAFPVRAFSVARTGQVYAGDGWSRVFAWDGRAWAGMAPGMTPQIIALTTNTAGNVYAAGTAMRVEGRLTCGGIPSEADLRVGVVVKWTDGAWVPLGVFDAEVSALATEPTGGIYAAGSFLTESGRPVGHVARLVPGHRNSKLGSGSKP